MPALNKMAPYFQELSKYHYENSVSVADCCWVSFTVPTELSEVFEDLINEHYLAYESKDIYIHGTEYAFQTDDDALSELQVDVCKQGIPHSVRAENSSEWDHWQRADYRYINGVYMRHVIGHDSDYLWIRWLERRLKEQAYVAIQVEVEQRILRSEQPDFTQDDTTHYKTNQLRKIIDG